MSTSSSYSNPGQNIPSTSKQVEKKLSSDEPVTQESNSVASKQGGIDNNTPANSEPTAASINSQPESMTPTVSQHWNIPAISSSQDSQLQTGDFSSSGSVYVSPVEKSVETVDMPFPRVCISQGYCFKCKLT